MKKVLKILLAISFMITAHMPVNAVSIKENDGIYHIILEQNKKLAKRIKCVTVDDLMTNEEVHKRSEAILTINGGFFDPNNKKTISYVTTDGHNSADPLFNESLFADPILRKNLDKILNRSEFRVLECFSGYKFEITQHKSPIDFECQLMNSIQAGPLVYPKLQLEEEFFILKDEQGNIIRESASASLRTARTIVGLKNKEVHFIIFTDKHPMTLEDVSKYCEEIGLDRAMALDGGSSTSLNYLDKINIASTPDTTSGRMLKSFIILKKK